MELHGSDDIIFGKRLRIWGQKFMRNSKQNYIKILGSAGADVYKTMNDQEKISQVRSQFPHAKLYGQGGDLFNKKERLLAEPEKHSDCPTATGVGGGKKHRAKMHGHTPATAYNVYADDFCAICYIDRDLEPRKRNYEIRAVGLSKDVTLGEKNN